MMQPPQPSWWEHVDLMQVIIAGCMAMIVFMLKRWLDRSDKERDTQVKINEDLYTKYNGLNTEFHELKGEHNTRVCLSVNKR